MHKWSKCHLAPRLVRQNSSDAQETCGTGLQTRGTEPHLFISPFITLQAIIAQYGVKDKDTAKSPDVSLSSSFKIPFVSWLSCPTPNQSKCSQGCLSCPLGLSCLQLNGTQADVSDCLEFTKVMPRITQPCQLPCQDDCQLTNWSKFSSCTVDCVGVRIRKRTLIGGSRTKSWYLNCICKLVMVLILPSRTWPST